MKPFMTAYLDLSKRAQEDSEDMGTSLLAGQMWNYSTNRFC